MITDITFAGYDSVFATRLRELMKINNTTQKELAEIVGTTRQAISQYSDGSVQPNIEKLYKISSFYKVSSDWLIGKNEIKSPDSDSINIHKKIGLSDGAIDVLRALKNAGNDDLLSIVNFLLEQEVEYPEPYPYSFENDFTKDELDKIITEHGIDGGKKIINKMLREAEADYWVRHEDILADWQLEGYVQVLSKIATYIKVKFDENQSYKITTDQIEQTVSAEFQSIKTVVELSGNLIIDTVLLAEIQEMLKNLKDKYHRKQSGVKCS